MIKWKQAGMHMENFGMDLTNPNFVAHAESMGARGHRLASVRSLQRASLEEKLRLDG